MLLVLVFLFSGLEALGQSPSSATGSLKGEAELKADITKVDLTTQSFLESLNRTEVSQIRETNEKLYAMAKANPNRATAFLAGNTLFTTAPERSLELLQLAQKEYPQSASVALEVAYALVRKRSCDEALRTIDPFTKLGEPKLNLMRAICLVELGRAEEAKAAWDASSPAKNRRMLAETLFEVNPVDLPAPFRRLEKVESFKTSPTLERAIELLSFDQAPQQSWTSNSPVAAWVTEDLALVRRLHKSKQGLRIIEDAFGPAEKRPAAKDLLMKVDSSLLSRILIERVLSEESASEAELKNKIAPRFWARVTRSDSARADKAHDLHALAMMTFKIKPFNRDELLRINQMGRTQTDEESFETSAWLARAMSKETIDPAELAKAIAKHPRSSILHSIKFETEKSRGPLPREALIAALRAEFAKPSPPTPYAVGGLDRIQIYFDQMGK